MKKLALLFALALLAAACGGGSDTDVSDTSPPATAPTTAAAVAATTDDAEGDHADESHDEEESGDHADDDHADDAGSAAEAGDSHTDDDHEEESDGHSDGDHDEDGATDADRTVQVAMTDFAFEPDEFEAMAGETIEFVVTNLGVVEHEFRLSNAHRIEEHLASGHADHDEGGGHHEEGGDVILLVEPGGTGSVVVTFGDDTTLYTEVACLIPGHYEAGMKAPLLMSA